MYEYLTKRNVSQILEIEPMLGTSGEGFYRTSSGWFHLDKVKFNKLKIILKNGK